MKANLSEICRELLEEDIEATAKDVETYLDTHYPDSEHAKNTISATLSAQRKKIKEGVVTAASKKEAFVDEPEEDNSSSADKKNEFKDILLVKQLSDKYGDRFDKLAKNFCDTISQVGGLERFISIVDVIRQVKEPNKA